MRQQSSEAIRRAKRQGLTVELLEDRRVFSLTGLVPSLPGLLSQEMSLPSGLEAEVRLDTAAGGLRVELEVTTRVLDVGVVSDLGVDPPVHAGADVSHDTSHGGHKGLVALGATVGADAKVNLSPETGVPPITVVTEAGGKHGMGGHKGLLPIEVTVDTTTKIDAGESTEGILPTLNVSTRTDTKVAVSDGSTLAVDVTTNTTTAVGGDTGGTVPVNVAIGGTVTTAKGSGVPADIRVGGQTTNAGPTDQAVSLNNNLVGPLTVIQGSPPAGTAASPVAAAAAGGPTVDVFFRELALDAGGNAGQLQNAVDALAVEQLALAAPLTVGGAQEEDQDAPELQGADASGLSADLTRLTSEDSPIARAVGEQLSTLLVGTGTTPWLLALLAVALTACEITRRQLRHTRPRLSLAEAAALTGFSGLGTLWPLE